MSKSKKIHTNDSFSEDPYFASYMLANKRFEEHIRSKIYKEENGIEGKVRKAETLSFFAKRTNSGSMKIYRDKFDGVLGGKEGGITSRNGFKEEKFREGKWDRYKNLVEEYDKLSDEEKLDRLDFFTNNIVNEGNY